MKRKGKPEARCEVCKGQRTILARVGDVVRWLTCETCGGTGRAQR